MKKTVTNIIVFIPDSSVLFYFKMWNAEIATRYEKMFHAIPKNMPGEKRFGFRNSNLSERIRLNTSLHRSIPTFPVIPYIRIVKREIRNQDVEFVASLFS